MTPVVPLRERLAEPERVRRRRRARHQPRPDQRGGGRPGAGLARDLAADPRIDVLSITDNPGGHAMLAPDALGTDLISRGQEVIIHLACKDWNRNALESRGWQLGSEGFKNVLALSGDYPVTGHRGLAAPVFDVDSVGLLSLLADMNEGLRDERSDAALERTDFFLGCVVTNHKRHEREVIPQYLKLRKKARAGARFVINQIGWDVRKDDELLRWIRRDGLDLYALANVYLLSPTAARAFKRGRIPGVVVSDELLALAERHGAGPDKGRAFFVELAAKHVAVSRGLGFDGVYLGGHMPAETFGEILDRSRSFADGDWRELAREICFPLPDEFYFFEPDPDTGLSSDEVSASYLESKRRRRTDLRVPLRYRFSRPRPRRRVRPRGAALPRRPGALPRPREGPAGGAEGRPRGRAGGQGAAVPLPRLRRLLASRDRLRLPRVAVREEPAERPVRRYARRALRGVRHRVHLVAGVRAPQGLRRGGDDARPAGGREGQRARADQRLGEHLPRPRSPASRRERARVVISHWLV